MAQFRAVIQGQRGETSRLGSKKSGIDATVNGWASGVTLHARNNAEGFDEITLNATSGSNGFGPQHGFIGTVMGGKFYPSEAVKMRIIHEYQMACVKAAHACPTCGQVPTDKQAIISEYQYGIAKEAANGTRVLMREHDGIVASLTRSIAEG